MLGGLSVVPLMTYPDQLDYTGFFLWTLIKLGPGRRTQSEGVTLELLLTTHFPSSEATQELAAPAAAFRVGGWLRG
jgi:hypothetical protein